MTDIKKIVAIMFFLVLLMGMSTPVILAQTTSQSTLLDNLGRMKDFSTLASLAKTAGLDSVLNSAGPYTLFAPTNDALSKIPTDSVNALTNNKPLLGDLLKYHVVPGKIAYSDLARMKELKTVDGKTLPVTIKGGAVTVGGAKILNQGIDSRNGIIYPVDNIMMPPGFTLPQVTRSTGIPLSWIGLLLGALAIGGLLLYMLTRGAGRHAETYRAPPRRVEEPMRRAEEAAEEKRAMAPEPSMPDIQNIVKNIDLPLSGDSLQGLNELISKGTFKDKSDFIGFLAKTYLANNLGSTISKTNDLPVSSVMDIITKTGIGKGFMEGDIKKYLVPLLITGFMAVYKYMTRRPAVKPV